MADETVNENRIGKAAGRAAGEAVGQKVQNEISKLQEDIRSVDQSVQELQHNIDQLRAEMEEIERTKAAAERTALEDLKRKLDEELQEKKEEYQHRLEEVLDDYRNSVESLKDRFIDSISGREEHFDQIEDEFDEVREQRRECIDMTISTGEAAAANFDARVEAIVQSRNAFTSAIDDFVTDREDTAATIDSIQTTVPDITDSARIVVPFWVVGIEMDGREEIRVLPVLDRGNSPENPKRATPYVEYLREHPTHSYGDMTDAVHAYVSRDDVRDDLARREGEFADPGFLADRNLAMERFLDALQQFELRGRGGNGTEQPTAKSDGTEPDRRQEVSVDD